METEIAAVAVVLACCLLVFRFTTDRWRHRFRAIGSPLIRPPGYRLLFLLVFVGVLLVSTLPEAVFVLPALDAVGLDLVTIMVALELRHYLASVVRRIPMSIAVYLRVRAQIMIRCGGVLRTNPVLLLYACMWPVIWIRTLMGKMSVMPPAQG